MKEKINTYTLEETARIANINRYKLYRLRKKHCIRTIKRGRNMLIPKNELNRLLVILKIPKINLNRNYEKYENLKQAQEKIENYEALLKIILKRGDIRECSLDKCVNECNCYFKPDCGCDCDDCPHLIENMIKKYFK